MLILYLLSSWFQGRGRIERCDVCGCHYFFVCPSSRFRISNRRVFWLRLQWFTSVAPSSSLNSSLNRLRPLPCGPIIYIRFRHSTLKGRIVKFQDRCCFCKLKVISVNQIYPLQSSHLLIERNNYSGPCTRLNTFGPPPPFFFF